MLDRCGEETGKMTSPVVSNKTDRQIGVRDIFSYSLSRL